MLWKFLEAFWAFFKLRDILFSIIVRYVWYYYINNKRRLNNYLEKLKTVLSVKALSSQVSQYCSICTISAINSQRHIISAKKKYYLNIIVSKLILPIAKEKAFEL